MNLDALKMQIENALRLKARRSVVALIADCLGSHDGTILNALGVDAKEKLLQIFTEEAIKLLKEDTDADT